MKVLIACEFSAIVRDAFRAKGHEAYSVDLLPTEGDPQYHFIGDVLPIAYQSNFWDLMIAHPPCTRLANSGVRWLNDPPEGKTIEQMWKELEEACKFYNTLKNAPIPKKAIENPLMHRYAKELTKAYTRNVVQPWWFGHKEFKATGFELFNLPPLKPTNIISPPKSHTKEHAEWSKVHRASPGPDRWKERSRSFKGIAEAMADQWGQ